MSQCCECLGDDGRVIDKKKASFVPSKASDKKRATLSSVMNKSMRVTAIRDRGKQAKHVHNESGSAQIQQLPTDISSGSLNLRSKELTSPLP